MIAEDRTWLCDSNIPAVDFRTGRRMDESMMAAHRRFNERFEKPSWLGTRSDTLLMDRSLVFLRTLVPKSPNWPATVSG
jgi:hypothetical protein